jgi:hypothetical protein
MKQIQIPLIVEKSGDQLWGRITVNDNLIIDTASTLESLKKKLAKLAKSLENVEVDSFVVSYDLTSFFEQYSFLSISEIASKIGINPSLMRQYSQGIKFPSGERVKEIESAIRQIGKELSKVKLHKAEREFA